MSDDQDGVSKRITDRLTRYWSGVKGDRLYPSIEMVNMDDIDEWDRKDSFLMKFEMLVPDNIQEYVCRFLFLGENIAEKYNKDESGKYIRHMVVSFLEDPNDVYDKVIQTKQPLETDEIFEAPNGTILKYRQILLPLGPDDSKPVNGILGGMRFIHG